MINRPQLSHISEIEQYKTENSLLIEYLGKFDPNSEKQLHYANIAYKQYKEIQSTLVGIIDSGEIPTLEYNIRAKKTCIRKAARRRIVELRSCSCELCGNPIKEILEVHHKKPVSQGGTHDEDNLIVLCASCHAVIHACIERGGINDRIRDYYVDGVEKLEELVKKGIGDD